MACKHERLRTVGRKGVTRVFCVECGAELDIAFLEAKNGPKKAAEEHCEENPQPKKTRARKGQKTEE